MIVRSTGVGVGTRCARVYGGVRHLPIDGACGFRCVGRRVSGIICRRSDAVVGHQFHRMERDSVSYEGVLYLGHPPPLKK